MKENEKPTSAVSQKMSQIVKTTTFMTWVRDINRVEKFTMT